MFHSEYCLYCRLFSRGKNRADCGRPCRKHTVRLRDRLGVNHLVLTDSQCRNTVFHADAQDFLEYLPRLRQQGIRHFRIELLAEDSKEEIRRTLNLFL